MICNLCGNTECDVLFNRLRCPNEHCYNYDAFHREVVELERQEKARSKDDYR